MVHIQTHAQSFSEPILNFKKNKRIDNMKHIFKASCLCCFFLLLSGCSKDFLDRPSPNVPTLDTYYVNAEQVNGATALLYNQVWYNYMDKAFHCIGEVLSGNMLTSAGDANYGFNSYVYFT